MTSHIAGISKPFGALVETLDGAGLSQGNTGLVKLSGDKGSQGNKGHTPEWRGIQYEKNEIVNQARGFVAKLELMEKLFPDPWPGAYDWYRQTAGVLTDLAVDIASVSQSRQLGIVSRQIQDLENQLGDLLPDNFLKLAIAAGGVGAALLLKDKRTRKLAAPAALVGLSMVLGSCAPIPDSFTSLSACSDASRTKVIIGEKTRDNFKCTLTFADKNGIIYNFFDNGKQVLLIAWSPGAKEANRVMADGRVYFFVSEGKIYRYDASLNNITFFSSVDPDHIANDKQSKPQENAKAAETLKTEFPRWMLPTVRVWQPELEEVSRLFNHDPRTVAMFLTTESMGDPYAVSPSGAEGLIQIMPTTWTGLVSIARRSPVYQEYARRLGIDLNKLDPFNPIHNIFMSNVYLESQAGLPKGLIPTDQNMLNDYKK